METNLDKLLEEQMPLLPIDWLDVNLVLLMGATKYAPNNWLEPDGKRSTYKEYHDSMFHHLAKSFSKERLDPESNLDHLLHVAVNALMCYTRLKRNIKHPND